MYDTSQRLRAQLSAEQYQAAVDPGSEVLTLACAGSGKSRTLAFRIARLVSEGSDPKSIVAFTFTEKAADTIKLRVAQALSLMGQASTAVGAIYIGTIHSYCHYVLGQMDARYRQVEVLDGNRLKLFLISRYSEIGMLALRVARSNPLPPRYFETVRRVADAWTALNDELIPFSQVFASDPALGKVLEALRMRLARDQFIDFSLMVRLVVEALVSRDKGALLAIAGLKHLLVDEYQDVNPSQEGLIRELHRQASTLFVVGDDDQAIFGWRGADVNNILSFHNRYPGSGEHTLSQNFRSTPAIVSTADRFAAAELGPMRIAKNPTAPNEYAPRDFRRLWFQNRDEEASWVADRIQALLGSAYEESDGQVRGLRPSDFAILMRSTRSPEQQGGPRHLAYTKRLRSRGIPYTLEAGGGVFDRPQVATLRATFELLRDGTPNRRASDEHFQTVVAPVFPEAVRDEVFSVLSDWGRVIHVPLGSARPRVYPQRLVHELLRAFGIAASQFDPGTMQDIGVFSRIIQDLETVYVSIDTTQRFKELLNFLQKAAEAGYDTATEDIFRRPDTVMVSTVHKAKGLEFPVVFVVDVEASRFPQSRTGYDGWIPSDVIRSALTSGTYQNSPQEEARLFYTALTRAERYLYVTGSDMLPGAQRSRRPSRFAIRLQHSEVSTDPAGLPTGLAQAIPRRRVEETIVPTSFSEIRYFLRCPADYRFRKIFGFSPPITELLGFGRSIHAAIGRLHQLHAERPPTPDEAEVVGRETFHVHHVAASSDPINRPGPYEGAKEAGGRIVRTYAESYGDDFGHKRQLEVRFEVPVRQAVVSGSIDLLLHYDRHGNIVDARIVDFKAIDSGDDPERDEKLYWTELALQVQLYAMAATEILGHGAATGAVHLLKNNKRVNVPVSQDAIAAAVANVEWAIDRVVNGDFPMRPHPVKCDACDFKLLCLKQPQEFSTPEVPPPIHVPGGTQLARAFSETQSSSREGLEMQKDV